MNVNPHLLIEFNSNLDNLYSHLDNIINKTITDTLIQVVSKLNNNINSKYPAYADIYTNSVYLDVSNYDFTFYLKGKLANKIEHGIPAYDMKPFYRPNAKISSNGGWYATVPFRHKTPNRKGNAMSNSLYRQVKTLQANQRYVDNSSPRTSSVGYTHKTSIYNGMRRIVNSNTGRGQYFSFRRISNNSDPLSWHHPGLKPANILADLVPYAKSTFIQLFSQNLNRINPNS